MRTRVLFCLHHTSLPERLLAPLEMQRAVFVNGSAHTLSASSVGPHALLSVVYMRGIYVHLGYGFACIVQNHHFAQADLRNMGM
jgi:hypothetical protein